MKKSIFILFAFLAVYTAQAQVPQYFKYQAVLRDNADQLMANQNVEIRITIVNTSTATDEYIERHNVTTSEHGLITLNVGGGANIDLGDFTTLNWSGELYSLKVEVDAGSGFEDLGTSELLSVPYALYAQNAGSSLWAENGNTIYNANAGNVGIGISYPTELLHVMTDSIMTSPSIGLVEMENVPLHIRGNYYTIGQMTGIGFSVTNAGNLFGAGILFERTGGNTQGKLHFATKESTVSETVLPIQMTIDQTGKVGIGTTEPFSLLEVSGTDSVSLRVVSTNFIAPNVSFIRPGTGYMDWRWISTSGGIFKLQSSSNDFGSVVGTSYLRDVMHIFTNSSNVGYVAPGVDNSISSGSASNRWSVVYAVNGTINTSDGRDKTNIQPLNYGIEEIMQLRPVSFNWKSQPEQGAKLGFIAQEVEPILKEVVRKDYFIQENEGEHETSDEYRYGIFYSDIIPVLVKAIQEQQSIIVSQQQQIDDLQQQIDELRNMIQNQ